MKKFQREFHKHCIWDPAEDGLTPFKAIAVAKARHVVKRRIIEEGQEKTFEKKGKDTLFKVLEKFWFGDLVAYMAGMIQTAELLSLVGTASTPDKNKYRLWFGEDKNTFDKWREAQAILTEVGQVRTVSTNIGDFELDPDFDTTAMDNVLSKAGLPPLEKIMEAWEDSTEKEKEWKNSAASEMADKEKALVESERLSEELKELAIKALAAPSQETVYEADGTIPSGKMVFKKAAEVFPHAKLKVDFEIPVWQWDGEHPNVPQVDSRYIFREKELARVLYAIITDQRAYLHGHTGTGKTTLIEQVAARLGYPVHRLNMDSEVSRMDLIGRDVLNTNDEGVQVSKFTDGTLARALSEPCFLIVDEIDFVRPDVAYVMQAALEGDGLRIMEDGDRYVRKHPNMRIFATGNTVGQGDEHGMYQGARPQSIALLDRFTVWVKVDYLTEQQRSDLVKRHFPMLTDEVHNTICQYTKEHLAAFKQKDILQPISPRSMLAIAQAAVVLGDVHEALEMSVFDKASEDEAITLRGLVQRVG